MLGGPQKPDMMDCGRGGSGKNAILKVKEDIHRQTTLGSNEVNVE